MSAFIEELLRTTIYKRNQGRITRQVTFAAIALGLAIGMWRMSQAMMNVDPTWPATHAEAFYDGRDDAARDDARLRIAGRSGQADVVVTKGEKLQDVADAVNVNLKATDVGATLPEKEKNKLRLASRTIGAAGRLKVEVLSGSFPLTGLNAEGEATGHNAINLGLRYAVPLVLLAIGLWVAYRLVNMPGFADFLIAVEAEMNKVSWPTRHELARAATVVLVLIFFLAGILLGFDVIWQQFFHRVLHIV